MRDKTGSAKSKTELKSNDTVYTLEGQGMPRGVEFESDLTRGDNVVGGVFRGRSRRPLFFFEEGFPRR